MKTVFKIYFEDLTEVAQHYLCVHFKTNKEKEKRNNFPLAVIERELEESNDTE